MAMKYSSTWHLHFAIVANGLYGATRDSSVLCNYPIGVTRIATPTEICSSNWRNFTSSIFICALHLGSWSQGGGIVVVEKLLRRSDANGWEW